MKQALVLGIVMCCVCAFAVPYKEQPVTKAAVLVNYTWYGDPGDPCPNHTDPIGTCSDVNTEVTRLRNLFSGYSFSQYYSSGTHPYEWGHYPFYTGDAIIYSNIP